MTGKLLFQVVPETLKLNALKILIEVQEQPLCTIGAKAVVKTQVHTLLFVKHEPQATAITQYEVAEQVDVLRSAAGRGSIQEQHRPPLVLGFLQGETPFRFAIHQVFTPDPALGIGPARTGEHIPANGRQGKVG